MFTFRIGRRRTDPEGGPCPGPIDPLNKAVRQRDGSGVTAVLVTAGLALIVALWAIVGERIAYERAETVAAVTTQNESLARTLEVHTERTLAGVDQALHFLRYQYGQEGPPLDIHRTIADVGIDDNVVTDLAVIDEHGMLVLGRTDPGAVSVADRDYFRIHQRDDDHDLFISRPALDRVTGRWTIFLTLRVNRPDGSFGGIVLAAVDPGYFTRFHEQAELGGGGLVALVGLDGIVRARQVGNTTSFGEDLRNSALLAKQAGRMTGSFTSTGEPDGTPRFYSYRTLQRYPLIVAVATPEASILAPVRERARDYRIVAALATASVILFVAGALIAIARHRRAAAALADTEVRFRGLVESMPQLVWICRPDGWSIYFNQRWVQYTGLSLEESYGYNWARPIHPDDKPRAWEAWQFAIDKGEAYDVACRLRSADGAYHWVIVRSLPMRDIAGSIVSWFGTCTDIDQQKQTEAALQESERFAHATIDALPECIAVLDASGRIVSVNQAWREFADADGAAPAPIGDGGNYLDACDRAAANGDSDAAAVRSLLNTVLSGARSAASHVYTRRAKSGDRWFGLTLTRFPGDGMVRVVVAHEDVTEQKAHEIHIEYLATHDALTDLPNRNLLSDRIAQAINRARREGSELAVLFVDLDNFKHVNDGFGHAVGDELLRKVAGELQALVRGGDTVARLGGDEFVLLLDNLKDAAFAAATISRKALDRFSRPFLVGNRELTVTTSIGISLYPKDGQDPEMLLMNADAAMYHAKEGGRNSFQFSAPEMKNKAIERVALGRSLRNALQLGQFELHYQPLVMVATGEPSGVEALIRWRHPELGLVLAEQFIAAAEETGLIIPIGEWVLRTACAQNKAWQDAGLPPLAISVNLSARQLRQDGLVDMIAKILDETGLEALYLDLELTETMVMGEAQATVDRLHALKALGVLLSIDDFGTGYSKLADLKTFPLDQLKIDRSFIEELPDSGDAASITRAIVGIGHSLGLRVVAEGVETPAQAQFLASIWCGRAQGFHYSKPLPAAEFARWLASAQAMRTSASAGDEKDRSVAA